MEEDKQKKQDRNKRLLSVESGAFASRTTVLLALWAEAGLGWS